MQYLKLVLVFLLPLSSALLQTTKTVLPVITLLLKKFHYSFFCSLLMSTVKYCYATRGQMWLTPLLGSTLPFDSLTPPFSLYSKYVLFKIFLYFSHWLFHLLVKESCRPEILSVLFSLSLIFSDFQSSCLRETTKSCRFEACILNFKVQLNFSLII